MKWEKVRLEELYEVHNGLSKGRKFFGSGYPFLSFSTVFNNYFIPSDLTDFVQSTEKEQDSYSIKRGDVFVTRTSETSDELGMSCVALKDYPYATYNGFTKRMRPKDATRVLPEYIGYYMRMPSFRGEFQAFSTMTTRASLRNEDLLGLEIALPPIETQHRIASILSAYDDLIENNQKQIKFLEEAAQRLYKEWFVDLRFPNHENTPIVDGIPKGWSLSSIEEIGCNIESGARPKGGIDSSLRNGVPSIGAENVIGLGKYNFSSDKFVSSEYYASMKRGKLKDRDILVYKDGAYIGRTSLFQDGFPHQIASVNEHVFLVHAKNEMLQYYLFFTLYQHEYYLKMQKLNKNAAQPGINSKAMLSLKLLLPPSELIQKFDEFIAPVMKNIFAKAKENRELVESRDRLLPKLMSGELEV
mgnify:CR=1 FL=1